MSTMSTTIAQIRAQTRMQAYANLARKFGLLGFTFFLVKGLLWLAAPLIFVWFT